MNWYEELPDKCPPNDATEPNGQEFFRLCVENPAIDADFYSQKKLSNLQLGEYPETKTKELNQQPTISSQPLRMQSLWCVHRWC